jgi:hypothetical protein
MNKNLNEKKKLDENDLRGSNLHWGDKLKQELDPTGKRTKFEPIKRMHRVHTGATYPDQVKREIKQRSEKGGIAGPKGHLPEQGVAEEFNGEYDDEAGMASGSLHTLKRAVDGLMSTIDENDNLPEWCQEKISLAEDYLVTVWDYIQSQKAQGIEPELNEHKKGVKAMKYTKKAKPTNPVAKNAMAAIGGGAAGEHDNKKKKVDRKSKHKKKDLELAESNWYEIRLNTLLESKIKK